MKIVPSTAIMLSNGAQLFEVDDGGAGCQGSATPDVGKRKPDSTGKTCVYRAPWLLLTRTVALTAHRADGESATAVVTVSSAPFWMGALAVFWAVLFVA